MTFNYKFILKLIIKTAAVLFKFTTTVQHFYIHSNLVDYNPKDRK